MKPETTELILSAVLAASTVCYTIINLFILKESKRTRLQKLKPQIIAYLKSTEDHQTLMLCIKNIGEGCEKNVKATMLHDYNAFEKGQFQLSNFKLFTEGINVFPPEYELHYYINWWEDLIRKDDEDEYVELLIDCCDINNKPCEQQHFVLPFKQIASNYSNPPETYIGQIAYYLKEISKNQKK